MAQANQMPRVTEAVDIASTRWLKLQTLKYVDVKGEQRAWDVAVRTTTKNPDAIDAVSILAILCRGEEREIVLVRQFRPPMRKMSIEFPAGLVDDGETPENAAIRELYEETGFRGTIRESFSSVLSLTPGLSAEKIKLVEVHVDLSLPENQHPKQKLDEGENIEVLRMPLKGLRATLDRLHEEGNSVFAPTYYFAVAHELESERRGMDSRRSGTSTSMEGRKGCCSVCGCGVPLWLAAVPLTAAVTIGVMQWLKRGN